MSAATPEPRGLAEVLCPEPHRGVTAVDARGIVHGAPCMEHSIAAAAVMAHLSALAADPAVRNAMAEAVMQSALDAPNHENAALRYADAATAAFLHAAGGQP